MAQMSYSDSRLLVDRSNRASRGEDRKEAGSQVMLIALWRAMFRRKRLE